MIKYLLPFFLISQLASAQCLTPVKYFRTGDTVDCDSFRFSPDAEKDARQSKEDNKFYKSLVEDYKILNTKQNDKNDVLTHQLEIKQSINDNLTSQLNTEKSFLNKVLYISAGAFGVILIKNNVR